MQWSVYNEATKRTQYSTVPTSSITAEAVTVDGCILSQKKTVEITDYQANALNQYAMLSVDDITDFIPSYDAAGNQTRVKTSTGIWAISYDAENRPTDFTKVDSSGSTSIHCEYDHMGRRATKTVTVNNNVTLHQRYIYRGYLQIAALDLTRAAHPALWYITWDPTQPVATRPLAIQKDGAWFTYGWDLSKNICEVYGQHGYIRSNYSYSPYGAVTISGDVKQPIQWSSECMDSEMALVYYNFRHYNPMYGRWVGRDILGEAPSYNLYLYLHNYPSNRIDILGNAPDYAPQDWNNPRYQYSNNCYSYACNIRIDGDRIPRKYLPFKLQPGQASGINEPVDVYTCELVMNRSIADGLYVTTAKEDCACNYNKVALIVGPLDYHWYRLDSNGYWSHKPGSTPVTNRDENGNLITNPETAKWNDIYIHFCAYMCAPRRLGR